MADIDDNPKDLTLAEAISYLAFDCLLAKEDLTARQEFHSDRSKAQSAMVSEMLDTMLPGEELPKGLKPEEEKKRREELKQEEARKTRLYGGAKLNWIYSRKGDWLDFTPDDAAKIDDACNRLVKGMIDEKVTGTGRLKRTGRLKKDDKLNNERQDIPPGFLRSGVHVNPLADSIDEDILLPGNFGRPLKGYRYVQINRAELVAAKRAEKQQPDRSSGGFSEKALCTWYKEWVAKNFKVGKIPARKDDWEAAKNAENAVSKNVPRDAVRALRKKLAPETWTAQGRRKDTN